MSGYDSALIGLEISEHPKLLALPRGVRLLALEALIWSCARHTDGEIPQGALPRLTDEPEPAAAAAQLVKAGQWQAIETGWQIVGFEDMQLTSDKISKKKDQARDRYERWLDRRSNALPNASANASTNGARLPARPTALVREGGKASGSTARSPLNGGSPSPPLQLVPGKGGPAVRYLDLSQPCALCHTTIPANDPVYSLKGRGDVVHPECGAAAGIA